MSDTDKNTDDNLYESLLQDLGLELELDKPIGKSDEALQPAPVEAQEPSEIAAPDMMDTLMSIEDSGDEVFNIRDADQPGSIADSEATYGEVELSPELINELKSVMGLGDGPASDQSNAMSEDDAFEQDVFKTADTDMPDFPEVAASDDPDLGMLPEAGDNPGVVEDPFLVALPDEGETLSNVFDQADNAQDDDEVSDAELASSLSDDIAFESFGEPDDGVSTEDDFGALLDDAAASDDVIVDDVEGDIPEDQSVEEFLSEAETFLSSDDVTEDTSFDVDFADPGTPISDEITDLEAVEVQDFSSPLDIEKGLGSSDLPTEMPGFEDQAPPVLEGGEPTSFEVASEDDDLGFELSYLQDDGGDRLVPRITINAFCETVTTTKLMNSAMGDRRMANVTMEVLQGGVAKAIEVYNAQSLPHLIIVESTGNPKQILTQLDELALLCDENVKVIVVGAANDIRLYRELMNRGVSDYLVPPIETVQLIRSVSNLFVDPEQPFLGKTIAVTGVKGGVGSSTIAHNLAYAMAERIGANTTLVDLDLNFGTSGLDFNNETQQTVADALLAPDRFDEAVLGRLTTQATERLSLFTAPATLDRTYDVDPAVYEEVLGLVRQSVPFALLDLPHIWTDWFKGTVVSADEIVVVAQPDLASLRNGKNLIDFLKAARPNDEAPRLVINNVGVPKRPEIPVKDFAQAIEIEPALVLPFDPQLFGTAANNGQMICEVAPESKCSQGVDYLASLVSGREIKAARSSLIGKLFKR